MPASTALTSRRRTAPQAGSATRIPAMIATQPAQRAAPSRSPASE